MEDIKNTPKQKIHKIYKKREMQNIPQKYRRIQKIQT